MKRRYGDELAQLAATYEGVRTDEEVPLLRGVIDGDQAMVFVGSGGTVAVARLAADLHQRATGRLAVPMTPLNLVGALPLTATGVCLISARGKHPDALLSIRAARLGACQPIALMSCLDKAELPAEVRASGAHVQTVRSPRDGFLATNSLLAMAAAMCQIYDFELSVQLPMLADPDQAEIKLPRRRCLVLVGPGYGMVGADLEARYGESGLCDVQVLDYRNLAHGRHVGLTRNLSSTTVVAIVSPETEHLAEKTLGTLPSGTDVIRMATPLRWPSGALDLLVASMKLVGASARDRGVDPGQPKVPTFGRRLYHLPLNGAVEFRSADPVSRKVGAAALGLTWQAVFAPLFEDWLTALRLTRFGGLVLDYDGTCCSTAGRFQPPPTDVCDEILRLLDKGMVLGFASGRGKSLHEATRGWMPREYWPQTHIGLYNGSLALTLADDPPPADAASPALADAADRIEELPLRDRLEVERRATQVSISGAALRGPQLLPLIHAALVRPPALPVKAVASAHSVDLLLADSGKAAVIARVALAARGPVLAIGDQGSVGGNDFELLAATQWSLSVDQCSADPTRCWNLDESGLNGPDLLAKYLRALRPTRGRFRFDWRSK